MKKRFAIPIYKAEVWLVVAEDMVAARKKMVDLFGDLPTDMEDAAAICSYDGSGRVGLFFAQEELCVEVIAHEVFHATHRLLDWAATNFDKDHHEHAALLHGYIMDLVMKEIYILKAKLK